jgi:ribonuclease P protein component
MAAGTNSFPRSNGFPRSHRLGGKPRFDAVFEGKTRQSRGPITIYSLPNSLGHPRLGISISRKVGTAPKRNRIKRLLRESFRLMRHDLPTGYDWVLVVRPHETAILADYQRMMSGMMVALHATWAARANVK